MFSKSKITQSMIDAVNTVVGLTEKVDAKKRTEETDKGESSTDAKGNKTTKYKDGSWQTETPTHKDDGKNPEGKVHHLSDVARRKMIKMNANNEEVELDEVLDTRKSIKSYLDKNDAQRTTLKASGTFDKVKKRLTGANKALDKLSKLNREEVLDERDEGKPGKMFKVIAAKAAEKYGSKEAGARVAGAIRKKVLAKEEIELEEKLNIQNTSMGDIIKDFQTSDAPQFAGKSQAKRRQMAIAAKMATEEYLDEDSDDKFASDVYSTTRGKVVKNKSGVFFATNKSGSTKSFTSEKQANRHAMKEEYLDEENAVDKVTMDVPLLIRIMEYSKEDAKSDMDLHKVAENLVEYSKSGKTLTMACYNHVVGINEAKRPEDDSVPFITNEDDLAGHVDKIKKTVKHTFKKVKANESYYDDDPDVARADRELARMKAKPIKADRKTNPEKEMSKLSKRAPKEDTDELDKDLTHKEEFNLGESSHTERKKSFIGMLDRISAKAKENTKLQQNRKIEPKLPKKDLDEAKKDSYQIYHPTYSSAVQHAEKHLNKQGFDIHPDDWFHHVNSGPSKPAEGKTVSLHIPLHKDGVPSKKVAHIQVYNRGNDLANNHELNMYHN